MIVDPLLGGDPTGPGFRRPGRTFQPGCVPVQERMHVPRPVGLPDRC